MSREISKKTRSTATRALCAAGLDGNGRFQSLSSALSAAFKALRGADLEAADIVSGDMLLGETGSRTCSIARTNHEDPFSPAEIRSSRLAFSWTRLQSGYEVVAYLT